MMHITLVKKIKSDGTACNKCLEVTERLRRDGLLHRIDCVIEADERAPESEGIRLALRHQITRAPFFIVQSGDGSEQVYDSFLRFKRDVLKAPASEHEEALDLLERFPGLDFL